MNLAHEMLREFSGRLNCLVRGLEQPLQETEYTAVIGGEEREFTHSRFNAKWMTRLGVESRVILELGSFDGGDAFRFSQAFPQGRVLSVEADPYRFGYVADRLAGTRVEVIHSAVCDNDGEVDWLPADEGRDAQGSLYQHTDAYKLRFPSIKQATHPVRIPSTRIDTLCQAYSISQISLLHMDIEGAEHAALSGLGELRPALIWAELCDGRFKGPQRVSKTHKLLDGLGYKPVVHLRHDSLYRYYPA